MIPRRDSFLAGLALVGFVAALAVAEPAYPVDPDPKLTPGAVATTDRTEICGVVGGLTYTRRHRVWTDRRGTLAKYGIPWSQERNVEDDDLVPVAAGGDNADPRNHWPEAANKLAPDGLGYQAKDWLDAFSKRAICVMNIPVAEVQAWFLEPADWRVAYRMYRGRDGR